jgi:hypothetical protein
MAPYSTDDWTRFLRALAASSAAAPDGLPNYTRCSRELGVSRKALRRRWEALSDADRDALKAGVEAAPRSSRGPPSDTDSEPYIDWARALLGHRDASDPIVEYLAWMRAEMMAAAGNARAQLANQIRQIVGDHRLAGGAQGGPPTPDEWVAQMVQTPALWREAGRELKDELLVLVQEVCASDEDTRRAVLRAAGGE